MCLRHQAVRPLKEPVAERSGNMPPPSGERAPSFAGASAAAFARRFADDPIGLLERARQRCGDAVRFALGSSDAYLFAHPAQVREVLVERGQHYIKNATPGAHVATLLGQGLVAANGRLWEAQRTRANRFFRAGALDGYHAPIVATVDELIQRWTRLAESQTEIDIHREMLRHFLVASSRTLFGSDLDERQLSALTEASNVFFDICTASPDGMRAAQSVRHLLDATIDCLIEQRLSERRRSDGDMGGDDYMGSLLEAHGAGEAAGRPKALLDEAITMLMASHETSATTLSFALWLIDRDAEIKAALRAEAREGLAIDRPATERLTALRFTRQVLMETMRLYPPVWMLERRAVDDHEIGGFHVARGSLVMLSPFVTHRHPAIWDDPERFDPQRFEAGEAERRPRYAFFPFGGGQRVCIGSSFAFMSMALTLATVVDRFHVDFTDTGDIALEPLFTLRPRGALPAIVRPAD